MGRVREINKEEKPHRMTRMIVRLRENEGEYRR